MGRHLPRSGNVLQMPDYLPMSQTRAFITVLIQDTTAKNRTTFGHKHGTHKKRGHERRPHTKTARHSKKQHTLPDKCRKLNEGDTYESTHQPVCVFLSVLRSFVAENHDESHDDRICRNMVRTDMSGNSKMSLHRRIATRR